MGTYMPFPIGSRYWFILMKLLFIHLLFRSYANKKRRRTNPYALRVHHKPAYNMNKPTPNGQAPSICILLFYLRWWFTRQLSNMSCFPSGLHGAKLWISFSLNKNIQVFLLYNKGNSIKSSEKIFYSKIGNFSMKKSCS